MIKCKATSPRLLQLRMAEWQGSGLLAVYFSCIFYHVRFSFWLNMTMMGVSAVMVVLMTAFWVANPTDLYT